PPACFVDGLFMAFDLPRGVAHSGLRPASWRVSSWPSASLGASHIQASGLLRGWSLHGLQPPSGRRTFRPPACFVDGLFMASGLPLEGFFLGSGLLYGRGLRRVGEGLYSLKKDGRVVVDAAVRVVCGIVILLT
ncbi:MAG: hypothetical protein HDS99_03690, partial [Bacteroidales bacterium]|nr:hypothetical protein [Bacteroidales bacterium]